MASSSAHGSEVATLSAQPRRWRWHGRWRRFVVTRRRGLTLGALRVVLRRQSGSHFQQIFQRVVPERRSETKQKNGQEHPRRLSDVFDSLHPVPIKGKRDQPGVTQEIVIRLWINLFVVVTLGELLGSIADNGGPELIINPEAVTHRNDVELHHHDHHE